MEIENLRKTSLLNTIKECKIHDINKAHSQSNKSSPNQLPSLQEFKRARSWILHKTTNDPETERELRRTISLYKSQGSFYDLELKRVYQECVDAYNQLTSLYVIQDDVCICSYVYIYDTENQEEREKSLSYDKLNESACIAQLPNGELFCYGQDFPFSGLTVILDSNFRARELPSGEPCFYSSAIYFKRNVYCFGGQNDTFLPLTLSKRFDLAKNIWFNLTPMPQQCNRCTSVIFNGDILIASANNRNLLLYSIEIGSFSEIPYDFAHLKKKILINAAERLYLIECELGSIYESEAWDQYIWKRIGDSIITINANQVYCSYNKGGFYISAQYYVQWNYYKFDLHKRVLLNIS